MVDKLWYGTYQEEGIIDSETHFHFPGTVWRLRVYRGLWDILCMKDFLPKVKGQVT